MSLEIGDPAPLFDARIGEMPNFRFHMVAGRPIVLSFIGSLSTGLAVEALRNLLLHHRSWFDDKRACFFCVSTDPMDERLGLLRDEIPGVRFIRDFDRKVSTLYGAIDPKAAEPSIYQAKTIVLDAMLRVTAVIPIDNVDQHNTELARAIAQIATELKDNAAPILVLQNVFEKGLCEALISLYQLQGGQSSGFMEEVGNKTVETLNTRFKKRRDVTITDAQLQMKLLEPISRRLVPAILQCFQFRVTHIERYLIACYEAAESGFFAPHRDNTTRGTAHRRWAVTVHLNDDYDGGELVFPEFGSKRYKSEIGSAIVFSCSLMHEVLPVKRGKRFAFLPFLHDAAAEQIRLQNNRYVLSDV